MPGFDGTGPNGEGSGTGGRRGYCYNFSTPFPRRGRRLNFSRPRARYFGMRNRFGDDVYSYGMMYNQDDSRDREISLLRRHADDLKADLNKINERLKALES